MDLGSCIVLDFWVTLILPTIKPLKCQHSKVLDLVNFFFFLTVSLTWIIRVYFDSVLYLRPILSHHAGMKSI